MKKYFIFLLCVILILGLTGCGKKDEALETYYNEMNSFTDEVMALKENMDMVDTTNPESSTELLTYLDEMENQFRILSEIEVPSQFAGNETLADEAYSYMQTAVSMYHEFYDDPESSMNIAEAAAENYTRAMKRLEYISAILKGEIPEGSDVEVTEEENLDFTPVTEDSYSIE